MKTLKLVPLLYSCLAPFGNGSVVPIYAKTKALDVLETAGLKPAIQKRATASSSRIRRDGPQRLKPCWRCTAFGTT